MPLIASALIMTGILMAGSSGSGAGHSQTTTVSQNAEVSTNAIISVPEPQDWLGVASLGLILVLRRNRRRS